MAAPVRARVTAPRGAGVVVVVDGDEPTLLAIREDDRLAGELVAVDVRHERGRVMQAREADGGFRALAELVDDVLDRRDPPTARHRDERHRAERARVEVLDLVEGHSRRDDGSRVGCQNRVRHVPSLWCSPFPRTESGLCGADAIPVTFPVSRRRCVRFAAVGCLSRARATVVTRPTIPPTARAKPRIVLVVRVPVGAVCGLRVGCAETGPAQYVDPMHHWF